MTILTQLALQFSLISLQAFGGANATLPEIQRLVVEQNHWMTAATFAHLVAIAQATPGPNAMIVTLIGWHLAGLAGALVTTLAMYGPCGILVLSFMHYWPRFVSNRWRYSIQSGVAPLAVGLVLASGCIIAKSTDESPTAWLLTIATVPLVLKSRLHPLWLLAAGAALGLCGVV